MFEKYFSGVIEQVYDRTAKSEKNIVMACYNNDFSLESLDFIERYSKKKDSVFFACKEFATDAIVGAYDPFLDVICEMYREYVNEDFDDFLTQCEVYELHREVLKMYYESGICKRTENVLVDEAEYEQQRMTKTISLMLKTVAEYKPVVLVINRFQLASESSMGLVKLLIEKPSSKIGIVLGANEVSGRAEGVSPYWSSILELLEDQNNVYHIGSTRHGKAPTGYNLSQDYRDYSKVFVQLNNVIELLDFKQAHRYFESIEKKIKFEEVRMADNVKLSLYLMHIQVSILLEDFSKALDIIEDITKLDVPERESMVNFQCSYNIATCYMYQGKLEEAQIYALQAKREAESIGEAEWVFRAEVLSARIQMAGWHNIFFCAKDVQIDPHLIEKLMHYNYRNHLAHFYIYAFDNRPEVVAKAYRSEAALINFSNGISIAKEIGNELLVYDAYQKNVMIASTNGMNEIALLYSIRAYQFVRDNDLKAAGRTLSAIGYNLSALGRMDESVEFYERAIDIFYQLRLPEDIAEVCYNCAMTQIAKGNYEEAERQLQVAFKVIDKLHLNSLRVCNLSKLYGIQAFLSTLQGNHFDSERYLLSCSQFLNYVLVKTEIETETVHDFEKSDDDVCLYLFAKALHEMALGDYAEAFADFEKSEKYYALAEGNLFFMHSLYRRSRMELFQKIGKVELYEKEAFSLKRHEQMVGQISRSLPSDLLEEVRSCLSEYDKITKEQIENIVKLESLDKENKRNKRQLEFISTWQKLLDVTEGRPAELVKNSIRIFLNHFNNDRAMYVRYEDDMPRVLYNDTGIVFTAERLMEFEKMLLQHPSGYAVSKISHTFFEHRDMIDIFNADEICSFALVPFMKNGKISSYFITYVRMKDNWHDSVNRYLLNEDDLTIYRLLFRELGHAINRLEFYEKIYDMNKRLKETATTDTLTGITNRTGMYERIKQFWSGYEHSKLKQGVGVMFIDLDNFKPYNDTYGHDIGDVVLREMAALFKDAVGDMGFVSRHGGDEFIIILYTGERQMIERIAQNIYRRIEEADGFAKVIKSITGKELEIDKAHRISCSIGIAAEQNFNEEKVVDRLIQKADGSMYLVKAEGKGNYKFV